LNPNIKISSDDAIGECTAKVKSNTLFDISKKELISFSTVLSTVILVYRMYLVVKQDFMSY